MKTAEEYAALAANDLEAAQGYYGGGAERSRAEQFCLASAQVYATLAQAAAVEQLTTLLEFVHKAERSDDPV